MVWVMFRVNIVACVHQVDGVKIDVSLRTPWPTPEEERGEAVEGVVREGGAGTEIPLREGGERSHGGERSQGGCVKVLTSKRLSLLAVDDGCDQEVGSEVDDELLEFSYTEDPPHTM